MHSPINISNVCIFKENFLKILLKIVQDILDMSLEESGLGTLGEIMTGEKGAGQPPVSTQTSVVDFLSLG